ncbi:serine/threonine-protein kinase [[Phormidium] sp. ETS-05]|uniref:serine/threonine-protein kinase n=1 Tax=[Phormidium] sp. ETS-05 TaxID=222819 RepID=UPI0018EED73F|nr:serine/threonine-protein kinase [[Phormidium] sp. ETS-05]
MSYCFNITCPKPHNPDGCKFCQTCGAKLLLKQRYRAMQILGQGGMGRTFLAVDEDRLQAKCAIKQFLPMPEIQGNSQAMAKATQLFEQEARQLLQLGEQHPQIPALLAYFEEDKCLYLVQQLIPGQNLGQELAKQGPFSERQILDILYNLLPVLEFIHQEQVIHRDIKPENILRRSPDGQLVLIDFGVSKQVRGTSLGNTGTRTGTHGYAPVEQIRGGKAFPASDIYSLGVTCIELLTGATLDDLFDPVENRWVWRPYLRRFGTDVSESLSLVLDKMLQDSLKERYQAAAAVLQDLQHQPAPPQKAHHQTPAHLSTVRPTATPNHHPPSPQNWQCLQTLTGHTDAVLSLAMSPDGRILASGSADKTIHLWQVLESRVNPEPIHILKGHTAPVSALAMSTDGKILVSGSEDKTIKLWQIGTGFLFRTLTDHSGSVFALAISPDGRILASGSGDSTIKIWQLSGVRLLHTLTNHSKSVLALAISANGRILASGSEDKTVKMWQLGNSEPSFQGEITSHSQSVCALAFNPQQPILASASFDKTIQIWDVDAHSRLGNPKTHSIRFDCLAFSPDGKTIATGCEDKTIKLWDVEKGSLVRTLRGHTAAVSGVAFSPNGQTMFSAAGDKTIKIWRLVE